MSRYLNIRHSHIISFNEILFKCFDHIKQIYSEAGNALFILNQIKEIFQYFAKFNKRSRFVETLRGRLWTRQWGLNWAAFLSISICSKVCLVYSVTNYKIGRQFVIAESRIKTIIYLVFIFRLGIHFQTWYSFSAFVSIFTCNINLSPCYNW